MKRVVIIGCPGSGKSTFARKLRDITGLPLYHLDMLYWNKDKTTVSKQLFHERLDKVLARDLWIIDGNYASTMEYRIAFCDTVFFLDLSTEQCLAGVRERKGKARSDMPWIEDANSTDREFEDFINSYNSQSRPKVLALLQGCNSKNVIIFNSREATEEYLKALTEKGAEQ